MERLFDSTYGKARRKAEKPSIKGWLDVRHSGPPIYSTFPLPSHTHEALQPFYAARSRHIQHHMARRFTNPNTTPPSIFNKSPFLHRRLWWCTACQSLFQVSASTPILQPPNSLRYKFLHNPPGPESYPPKHTFDSEAKIERLMTTVAGVSTTLGDGGGRDGRILSELGFSQRWQEYWRDGRSGGLGMDMILKLTERKLDVNETEKRRARF